MRTEQELVVGIGDIKVGKAPLRITTYLGSCIAVCLYAPVYKVGGMLHLMMASSRMAVGDKNLKKAKYADTGIPELLRQVQVIYHLERRDFQAKIFGGAKVLKAMSQEIGQENEIIVRKILKDFGIKVVAAKTGGEKGYRIEFDLETGKVLCRIFGENSIEF